MKIGITGSSGILGSNLRKILNNENFLPFTGKIENYSDVYKWIKKNQFDSIIHLAAIVPTIDVNKNKKYSLRVNVDGTKNLINAINLHSKKKVWFFYASTSHIFRICYKSFITFFKISYYIYFLNNEINYNIILCHF